MDIHVTGSSSIETPADLATVRFTFGFTGKDKSSTVARTVTLSNEARQDFERLKTSGAVASYSIESIRTWTTPGGTVRRAEISSSVEAEVEFVDFAELGQFVASAAERDGWTVNGVVWGLGRESRRALEPQVLGEALAHARERAEWIASDIGASNLTIAEVSDSRTMAPMAMGVAATRARGLAAGAGSEPLDLVPGLIQVGVHLQIRFEATLGK